MSLAFRYNLGETTKDLQESRDILIDYIRLPQCKRLINRILTAQQEYDIRSLAVLSHFPGEGRTLLVSVIALGFMTWLDKRVLIVDTVNQTREESFFFRNVMGNNSQEGIPISPRAGCIDLVTSHSLQTKNLLLLDHRVKAALCSQAPAMLSARPDQDTSDFRIISFINSVKSFYDLIIMDTCALTDVNENTHDPMILGQHIDATILLISEEALEKHVLGKLINNLKHHRIEPLGVVSNLGVT